MTEKTEKEQTSKSSQEPANENVSSNELSEEQLDKATGGGGKCSLSDFSFTAAD
jgi:hypothetical protein